MKKGIINSKWIDGSFKRQKTTRLKTKDLLIRKVIFSSSYGDVENSKKISAIKDEVVKTTEMSLIEHHLNDSKDQDEHDETEPNRIHQFKEVDVDLIMEEMGIHESLLHSSIQSDISVGGLNTKMQENHVIANPVTENKSVFLENEGDVPVPGMREYPIYAEILDPKPYRSIPNYHSIQDYLEDLLLYSRPQRSIALE
mgnify:CR=1 FL=1